MKEERIKMSTKLTRKSENEERPEAETVAQAEEQAEEAQEKKQDKKENNQTARDGHHHAMVQQQDNQKEEQGRGGVQKKEEPFSEEGIEEREAEEEQNREGMTIPKEQHRETNIQEVTNNRPLRHVVGSIGEENGNRNGNGNGKVTKKAHERQERLVSLVSVVTTAKTEEIIAKEGAEAKARKQQNAVQMKKNTVQAVPSEDASRKQTEEYVVKHKEEKKDVKKGEKQENGEKEEEGEKKSGKTIIVQRENTNSKETKKPKWIRKACFGECFCVMQ